MPIGPISLSFAEAKFLAASNPQAPQGTITPAPEADASTVPPANKITLYRSKDSKHVNPLTMTVTPGKFIDTKGKIYQYDTTDSPNVFKDTKGRSVYVRGSTEHKGKIAELEKEADRKAAILRDTPLPKYVRNSERAGGAIGAGIGVGAVLGLAADVGAGAAVGAGAGTMAGGPIGTVVGAVAGAICGAIAVGGTAAAVANLVAHSDQFFVRDQIEVLEKTGVLRRAVTVRDAFIHSGGEGMSRAFRECVAATTGDVEQIAEDRFGDELERIPPAIATARLPAPSAAATSRTPSPRPV